MFSWGDGDFGVSCSESFMCKLSLYFRINSIFTSMSFRIFHRNLDEVGPKDVSYHSKLNDSMMLV